MSKYFKSGACSVMDIQYPDRWEFKPSHIIRDIATLKQHVDNLPPLEYTCVKPGRHRLYIADVYCGYDTETTQFDDGDVKEAFVYHYQLSFADFVFLCRTEQERNEAMAYIQEHYPELGYKRTGAKDSETHQILIAIANLGFEFQFFCKNKYNGQNIVTGMFADEKRRPITVDMTWNGRERAFRAIDVLRIGSPSLASLAKDYCVTPKLKGDLDYDKVRNSKTPLTQQEEQYCINDVVILSEFMHYYIESFVKQAKLVPITKTGLVRAAVAHEFLKRGESIPNLVDMFPDSYDEYAQMMTMLYRGGYTHANAYNTGVVIENVRGYDFSSSYPAVMTALDCLYPVEKLEYANAPDVDSLDDYADNNNECWYATFEFTDFDATTYNSVESVAKIKEFFENGKNSVKTIKAAGITVDNGRILHAEKMTVMLTEQDWKTYRKYYTWGTVKVTDFHKAKAGYLPEYLTSVVKYFYKKKAELKRQGLSGTTAYIVAKQMTNSAYGLCVQTVNITDIEFDPSQPGSDCWIKNKSANVQRTYEKAVHKGQYMYAQRGKIDDNLQYWLPPQYGIWITAHARRRILEAIWELSGLDENGQCKNDGIYSDTDSVYFKNHEAHEQWFSDWNERVSAMNKQAFGKDFDLLGDLGTFDPVAIEWEDENKKKHESLSYSLKTWGAKRYIKVDSDGHMEQTIAGLPKGTVFSSIRAKHPEWTDKECAFNCFDVFKGDLELKFDESQKLTTFYNDYSTAREVTDEYGNTEIMSETSSVCLCKIPFKMTVDEFYQKLVEAIFKNEISPRKGWSK